MNTKEVLGLYLIVLLVVGGAIGLAYWAGYWSSHANPICYTGTLADQTEVLVPAGYSCTLDRELMRCWNGPRIGSPVFAIRDAVSLDAYECSRIVTQEDLEG